MANREPDAKVMVPSTRPSDLMSQNRHTARVIHFFLCNEAVLGSFIGAMAIGKAMNVYATESKNRQISNQPRMSEPGSESTGQASLSKAEPVHESAQKLMARGLAYMVGSMRKLNETAHESGFTADDSVLGTVNSLLVCELLLGNTSTAETHCRSRLPLHLPLQSM